MTKTSQKSELGRVPGHEGGPLMHVIAAKAVAFGEALTPEFKAYTRAVVENAKALADELIKGGFKIVTGGTDNHLMLVDLRPKSINGKASEASLGRAHITCNKNGVPFDPEKPTITSGIRLGTPAGTSRGFGVEEFREVGRLIVETLDGFRKWRSRQWRGSGKRKRACPCAHETLPDLSGI